MKKIIFLSILWMSAVHAWYSPSFPIVWEAEKCDFSKEEHALVSHNMDVLYRCIQRDTPIETINANVTVICQNTNAIVDGILFELEAQISRFETSLIDGKQYLKNIGYLAAGCALAYGVYRLREYLIDCNKSTRTELSKLGMGYIDCSPGYCGGSYYGSYADQGKVQNLLTLLAALEGYPYYLAVWGGALGSMYLTAQSIDTLHDEYYAEYYLEKYSLIRDALKQQIAMNESKECVHE